MSVGATSHRIARAFVLIVMVVTAPLVQRAAASQGQRQEPGRVETYDDLLVRVDDMAPGFGGMFVDADDSLAIYLLDTSQVAATRAAIDAVFGSKSFPARTRAVQGQYTVSQLKTWAERADALLEMRGVTIVDLDEGKNRVTIGLEDAARTDAVEQALLSLDVPRAAVLLKITGPINPVERRR
jgi:hypothetical protein